MPYADWSKRYACQKRWKQENRGKVRAQKQRARIKKKCLSKSLVVVLEDCCKKDEQLRRKLHQRLYQRNRKRMTKTLTVVLEDYRLKNKKIKTCNERRRDSYRRNREQIRAQRKECRQRNLEKCRAQERARSQRYRQKNEKRNADNERCRNYYQLNRERIRAQRKECRQKNLEKYRAQSRARIQRYRQRLQGVEKRCVELQKEWRRKNRDVVNERLRERRRTNREALNEKRREHRRQHRDVINRAECEYRRKHRETSNRKKRVRYWMKRIAARAEVPTSPCDCGLCLTCGGYETESWSHNVIVPRSDPLEVMERRLDQLETTWSDTSSEVDPALEKELERLLNETSSDEADSESEEDVVEQRLASLRWEREEDMTQRLVRWEREEAVTNLSAELGEVQGALRDMERWFEQFHREDEAQPDEYTQTLMVTSHLMNELERFLFSQ